jgi:hypothetical protein
MAVDRHQVIDKETSKVRLGAYYYKFDLHGKAYLLHRVRAYN